VRQATGFWSDDSRQLQAIFNKEFEAARVSALDTRAVLIAKLRAEIEALAAKRSKEAEIREELECVDGDAKLRFWIDLV
jgi:hypothetical protein